MTDDHTEGRWGYEKNLDGYAVYEDQTPETQRKEGHCSHVPIVAVVAKEDHARRIVAAVNVCARFKTEVLETHELAVQPLIFTGQVEVRQLKTGELVDDILALESGSGAAAILFSCPCCDMSNRWHLLQKAKTATMHCRCGCLFEMRCVK